MDVRQKLALIPRPIVHLAPRRLRDRWRTALLARERRRAQERARRRSRPERTGAGAAPPDKVAIRLDAIESKLDAVLARFESLNIGIEQLDARVSRDASGDAPSVADDIRELLEPIETLSRQLENYMADPEGETSETRRAVS